MRAYLSVFRLRLINGMQYRIAALAGIATQFFWGFMIIMVYEAFYANSTGTQSITLSQLATYTWLQQAFFVFVLLWYRDNELFNLITSGNIAYELCRPCKLYGFWYIKLIAQRLSAGLLRCLPILLFAVFLPGVYRMSLPPDLFTFFLFIISLILGLLVVIAISMFIYISVFITMSPSGSTLVISVIGQFLSGLIIPIPLMPEWFQKIVYVLPFRLTCDLPFRIYSGNIGHYDAIVGIITQVIWLIALVIVGKITFDQMLKRVTVQGG